MKPFAIYTAIVGNYDYIQQPIVVDERFDYLLFSNDIGISNIGVWQVRKIEYYNQDRIKIARWVKTHPHKLLKEYKMSVWIDASIQINSNQVYEHILGMYEKQTKISCIPHWQRDCIYDEILTVLYYKFDKEYILLRWGGFLRKENYPQHNGLVETGVLYREHNDSVIIQFDKLWWNCIKQYSKRDQLSFNYVLWKNNINYIPFLQKGENVRTSSWFICHKHMNSLQKRFKKTTTHIGMMAYYMKGTMYREQINKIYYRAYKMSNPLVMIKLLDVYLALKWRLQIFKYRIKAKLQNVNK